MITHTPLSKARGALRAPMPQVATCVVPDWSPGLQLSADGQNVQFGLMGLSTSCEPSYPVEVALLNNLYIDPFADGSEYDYIASSPGFDVTLPPLQNANDTGAYSYGALLDEYGPDAGIFDQAEWVFKRLDGRNWGPQPNSPECASEGTLLVCTTYSQEYLLG